MPPSPKRRSPFHGYRSAPRWATGRAKGFLHSEAAGGLVLVVATLVALAWANSPWSASYTTFWSRDISVGPTGHAITESVRGWVNDGLMTLFFFAIGLEIRDELSDGELASARRAASPLAGALGGMVLPAVLYLALNLDGAGSRGWGVPMATDVAFALGVLALLGDRVPAGLKVLLLAVAVVDDVGAIAVIAVFYSDGVRMGWLAAALAGVVAVAGLSRCNLGRLWVYVVLGSGVWLATHESGIHATMAGVVLGLLTPTRGAGDTVPLTRRLGDWLRPWTSWAIVPVFALANAGFPFPGTERSRRRVHRSPAVWCSGWSWESLSG